MTLEIAAIILGVIGIALTVFFGFRAVYKRRISQTQNVGKGGVGIQSGGDTKL